MASKYKMSNPLVNIKVQSPIKSQLFEPSSSNKLILSRRLMEIQPDTSSASYSYSGNNQIIFTINSVSDLLDWQHSYLRLKLTTTLSNSSVAQGNRYLAQGGAHALFREVVVQTAAGVQLYRAPRYNKHYAMHSQIMHSKDFVDDILMKAGDSVDDAQSDQYVFKQLSYTIAASTYTAALKTLVLRACRFGGVVLPGDLVAVELAAATVSGVVLTCVDDGTDTTIVFANDINGGVNVASPNVLKVYFANASSTRDELEMRNLAAITGSTNTDAITLCCKLNLPCLDVGYFPTMLLRGGIKIILTLEDPAYVLAFRGQPNNVVADYSVYTPVMVCDFVQPSEVLIQQYIDAYKTSGLKYVFPSYKWNMDSSNNGSSGNANISINQNVRSARYILSKIQDLRAETKTAGSEDAGVSTYTCDSIAQGRHGGLTRYRYVVNGNAYPLNGLQLDVSDVAHMEALEEVDRALNLVDVPFRGRRTGLNEWANVVYDKNLYDRTSIARSNRFMFGASLVKDPYSDFTGADLTLSPLQVELDFGSAMPGYTLIGGTSVATTPRYIHHFLAHDTLLLISADGTIVFS